MTAPIGTPIQPHYGEIAHLNNILYLRIVNFVILFAFWFFLLFPPFQGILACIPPKRSPGVMGQASSPA
jgi:hypothetical protein